MQMQASTNPSHDANYTGVDRKVTVPSVHSTCGGRDRQRAETAPVLQVLEDAGRERLQDLLLLDPAQEAQRDAPDVLVGVHQVVAQVLADQDLRAFTQ